MRLHIGIDDTDSANGGCTTYVAALLVEKFSKMGFDFVDYPNIIRLNPNIPYKTRGNAAVAIRLQFPESEFESVREITLHTIEENSRLGEPGTDPTVVLLPDERRREVAALARHALVDIISVTKAIRVLKRASGSAFAYGSGLGLVGALAAAGQRLDEDYTYELIAYRVKENLGKTRQVEETSVITMARKTSPSTFNNYDFENKRVLITPHGPDPVLLGIRGETPEAVRMAFRIVRTREEIDRWLIFRTNHGTDAHLRNAQHQMPLQPNRPAYLRGLVQTGPERIPGGHVFISLRTFGGVVQCAAFEPTGKFKEVVAKLIPGDAATVFGAVKLRNKDDRLLTVNLEKIVIHSLAEKNGIQNVKCPECGKRMKSAGRGQGIRCLRCGRVDSNSSKQSVPLPRNIQSGVYLPDLRAHRHLTKPLSRYGLEKKGWDGNPPKGLWHVP